MNGIDWGMTLLLAVSKISDQGRQLFWSPTVDALKWSGIKEYLDSPLSTDRIVQRSGCAIHHNDNDNSLLIFVVTDVIQI